MNYRERLLLFSSFIIGGFLPLGVIGYFMIICYFFLCKFDY